MMDVPVLNKIMRLVSEGKKFEDTDLGSEHKKHFEQIAEELESVEQGVMLSPINEWVGDEYDDLIAAFKRVDEKTVTKSIGAYQVSKAEHDKRYTLGAMYIPDKLDAHGEWTDSEELQRAVWDYVRTNDRRIRLQHNRDIVAGEWVEVMSFPYELSVPVKTMTGLEVTHTYPPNTVFLGVILEAWAWEKVQNGEILGYSIGGKAERLYVDMEKNDPTVSDVHVDTIMNPKKKKPKDIK